MNKDTLKKSMALVLEGKTLRDKLAILTYFVFKTKKLVFPVTLVNDEGIYFCGNVPENLWVGSKFCEPFTRPFLFLQKGAFLDVGAHIGKYSILLGKKYSKNKIFSFEPVEENFVKLKKNLRFNGIENAKILSFGLSNKKGKSKLFLSSFSGSHSLVFDVGEGIEIKIDTLDNVVRTKKISKVDLIKIDVEGAEVLILEGALKTIERDKPNILFEVWNLEQFERVREILGPRGYVFKKLSKVDYFATQNSD